MHRVQEICCMAKSLLIQIVIFENIGPRNGMTLPQKTHYWIILS
jgi:hypothetical protein